MKTLKIIIIFNILIVIISCSSNHKNIFRGLWYHYYQRGLSSMENEQYDLALKDFQSSISQRPDRCEDQRMLRTYGTRFIDFFPHREMGVIYAIQGMNDISELKLKRSIQNEPSEKAYYYLDKVRKRLFFEQNIKDNLPQISYTINGKIWDDDHPFGTNSEVLDISGTIQNNFFISELSINHEHIFIDHSKKLLSFRKIYTLPEGLHRIQILAKNLLGRQNKRTLVILIDRTGPVVALSGVDQKSTLKGYLEDESGILSLMINNKLIPVKNESKAWFTYSPEKNEKKISLIAKDSYGNQTIAFIKYDLDANLNEPILLAQNSNDITTKVCQSIEHNCHHINMELYGLKQETVVFSESIHIEGMVVNKNNKKMSLSINGDIILRSSDEQLFFNHPVHLKPGKNTIIVQAVDHSGRACTKKMTIFRQIPEIMKAKYKMPVYIDQFYLFDEEEENNLADRIKHLVISKSIEKNRFRVIPSLEILNNEKGENDALIVGGYAYQTKLGIEVVANVTNVTTREIYYTKDVYVESKNDEKIDLLAYRLVEKIHKEFLEIDGRIFSINDPSYSVKPLKHVNISLIQLYWPVIFYISTKIVNPVTGSSFGTDYVVSGDGYTTEISMNFFKAKSNEKLSLNINDGVKIK